MFFFAWMPCALVQLYSFPSPWCAWILSEAASADPFLIVRLLGETIRRMASPRSRLSSSILAAFFLPTVGTLIFASRPPNTFGLDYEEIYHRHHVTYDIYEEGKMTLDEYLWQIVFYEPRPFTPEDFQDLPS